MNAPANITAHPSLRWCPTCNDTVVPDEQGLCGGCDGIVDLVLWQETEEAWASDARAMECAEPADPFFASDRALNRGYGRV